MTTKRINPSSGGSCSKHGAFNGLRCPSCFNEPSGETPFDLPLDLDHVPADLPEAIEMLLRAKRRLLEAEEEAKDQRAKAQHWHDIAVTEAAEEQKDDWVDEVMAVIGLKCSFALETRDEIERRLRSARDASVEEDAERYRWLRTRIYPKHVHIGYAMTQWHFSTDGHSDDDVSAAIDRARFGEGK